TIDTYSHARVAVNASGCPGVALMAAAAIRIPATTASNATNSVVLNAALVSVERRRTWLATGVRPVPSLSRVVGVLIALIGTPLDVKKKPTGPSREAERCLPSEPS